MSEEIETKIITNDSELREKYNNINSDIDEISSEMHYLEEAVNQNDYIKQINELQDSIKQIPTFLEETKNLKEVVNQNNKQITESQNVFLDFIERQNKSNDNLVGFLSKMEERNSKIDERVSERISTIIDTKLNNNNEELIKEINSSKKMNVFAIVMSSITLLSVLGAIGYLITKGV